MAQVFDPPEGFDPPDLFELMQAGGDYFAKYEKAKDEFLTKLAEYLKSHVEAQLGDKTPDDIGKIAYFPVADGMAMYMVASVRPLQLVHLALGDAWHYQHIRRLRISDIRQAYREGLAKRVMGPRQATQNAT